MAEPAINSRRDRAARRSADSSAAEMPRALQRPMSEDNVLRNCINGVRAIVSVSLLTLISGTLAYPPHRVLDGRTGTNLIPS
jgi:hypothetical protein